MANENQAPMGVDVPPLVSEKHRERIEELRATVEKFLPKFPDAVAKSAAQGPGAQPLIMHQDAFAGDYQESEYYLLGMAIKYAGLHGVDILVVS